MNSATTLEHRVKNSFSSNRAPSSGNEHRKSSRPQGGFVVPAIDEGELAFLARLDFGLISGGKLTTQDVLDALLLHEPTTGFDSSRADTQDLLV